MRDYALVNFPDPGPLRSSLASLVDSFAEVIRIVRRVVRLVYFSLLVIIILITTGPFILFTSSGTSNSRRGRACRVFAQILYLLIPALFAWVVAGVLSAAGATVADLCNTVHEYRDHLLGTNVESTDNVLIKSGFDCPEANATELKAQIDNTANSILESTFLRQSTRLILNMSADGLAESAQWSGGEVLQKFNCSATVEFVGRIETVACGSEGWSAIDGIFDLWLSFIVMAVLLNIALFINLFGVQVSRSLFIFGRGDDVVSSKF